jgi:hypothetical protein
MRRLRLQRLFPEKGQGCGHAMVVPGRQTAGGLDVRACEVDEDHVPAAQHAAVSALEPRAGDNPGRPAALRSRIHAVTLAATASDPRR